MPSINEVYGQSNTLKAQDLKGRAHKVKIQEVTPIKFKDGSIKLSASLVGKEKALVLNKTNAKVIAKYFGDNYENWGNKEIEIFPTETDMNGQLVDCIRVRVEPPRAAPVSSSQPAFDDDIPF